MPKEHPLSLHFHFASSYHSWMMVAISEVGHFIMSLYAVSA